MKIAVINGSPKGKDSVTLRYIEFLKMQHVDLDFEVFNVGQQILKLEKNNDYFTSIIARISEADALLWATPVYYMLVPAQLKRFVELIDERNSVKAFAGKPAAALTTSIHFFDHTAVRYLQEVSKDLKMPWQGAYPAEMHDLFRSREKERLVKFWNLVIKGFSTPGQRQTTSYVPAEKLPPEYLPVGTPLPVDTGGKKIILIADLEDRNTNLAAMIGYLKDCYQGGITAINLADANIKFACRGCLACGADNRCFYEKRDSFKTIFEEEVRTADIIFFAGAIRDRFLSARFKMFMDRSFYLNHVPYLQGKQVGFLISGPLHQNSNLRDILEAYPAMHQGNLVEIVTDEAPVPAETDQAIQNLAQRSVTLAKQGYQQPVSFPAVGGRKVFRDFIAGPSQVVFPADYNYYRRNHFFDYPQRKKATQAVVLFLRNLLKIPRFRREFTARIINGMVAPLDRSLAKEKKRS